MRPFRIFAASAGIALLLGCGGDDDDSSSAAPADEFEVEVADDFSAGFPNSNWSVDVGFPFTDEERGNSPPGLVMGLFLRGRIRSDFTFSTADPLRLSFDLATPGARTASDTRFTFTVAQESPFGAEASFEVRLKDGEIGFAILGEEERFDFFTDAGFRTITFTADQGVATWSVNGQPFLTRGGFPEDRFLIFIEATGGLTLGFVVDNVILARPTRGRLE